MKSPSLGNSFIDLKICIMKSQVDNKPSVRSEKEDSCHPPI